MTRKIKDMPMNYASEHVAYLIARKDLQSFILNNRIASNGKLIILLGGNENRGLYSSWCLISLNSTEHERRRGKLIA